MSLVQLTRARSPRHNEILHVATALFSERGYRGTSMRDLADVLGLRRSSLYAHIESKEELLFDIVQEAADRFLERARAAASLGKPAPERLRAFMRGHVRTVAENDEAASVFLTEWNYLSSHLRHEVLKQRNEYEEIIEGIIQDGVDEGAFDEETDVHFAALLVLSAGNWMHVWYRPDGEYWPDDIADNFVDLIIRGIATGGTE